MIDEVKTNVLEPIGVVLLDFLELFLVFVYNVYHFFIVIL